LKVKGPRGVDRSPNLLRQEHRRQRSSFWDSRGGQRLPIAGHGDAVEELNARQNRPHRVLLERLGSQQQVLANLIFGEPLGRAAVVFGQVCDGRQFIPPPSPVQILPRNRS